MNLHEVIENQKGNIQRLKSEYESVLRLYINNEVGFNEVHLKGVDFFGCLEECSASNDSEEVLKDSGWNQWLAETCLDALPLILVHYETYRADARSPSIAPSSRAYAGIQRLAKRLDRKEAKAVRDKFKAAGLPTYGFDNKVSIKMKKNFDKYLGFTFGTIFLVVILVTAFVTPNPTSYQYTVFRIILALAAGGVGAVLPGVLEVKFKGWLRASGAVAFFIIVYFKSPAILQLNPVEPPKPTMNSTQVK
ncbi:hypothetical protein [Cronobacter sp. JZ38]|uniref:hypothetical protein n=1 Tax=Cronobacter sp. JZ38 TaxID=1906275 RepID=UPI0012A30600|nr:hypothetical protein [Cronobacter sp. JZ38]